MLPQQHIVLFPKNRFEGKRNIYVMKMKYLLFFSLYVNRIDFQRKSAEINKM